ncbi:MAG: hypothetical protein AAF378_21235 [Cyanobacteria bacterium P01_A01_bin.84]
MKPKIWKEVWLYVFFAVCGGGFYCIQTEAAWANESKQFNGQGNLVSYIPSLDAEKISGSECKKCSRIFFNTEIIKPKIQNKLGLLNLSKNKSSNIDDFPIQKLITQLSTPLDREKIPANDPSVSESVISQNGVTSESANSKNPDFSEKAPPSVEGQTTEIKNPSTEDIEEQLETPEINRIEQIEKLKQILQENIKKSVDPNNDSELGRIVVREKPIEAKPTRVGIIDSELGILKVKEKPIEQLPLPQPREADFKPVGSLSARVGYFHTNNIFSSEKNPEADSLIYSGLSLSSVPLKIASQTYLRGSIHGNLFRYLNNAEFNYNQFKVNLNLFQRLSKKMYAEIGWRHQELFYARGSDRFNFSSGEKFLDENSLHLSFGRRDPLTRRLMLDSFYELRVNLTNPSVKRNRVINFLSVSLNYYFKRSLRLGFGYQYNYSDFIERIREDQYHRLIANLNYGISKDSNISLQSGVTIGDSTQSNIDFDNWFFSVNYRLDLGKF